MGWSVVRQPNGRFAVFSSIVDDFILWHATRQDVIDFFVEDAAKEATQNAVRAVRTALEDVEPGYVLGRCSLDPSTEADPPTATTTKRWDDALRTIECVHGSAKAAGRREELSQNVEANP